MIANSVPLQYFSQYTRHHLANIQGCVGQRTKCVLCLWVPTGCTKRGKCYGNRAGVCGDGSVRCVWAVRFMARSSHVSILLLMQAYSHSQSWRRENYNIGESCSHSELGIKHRRSLRRSRRLRASMDARQLRKGHISDSGGAVGLHENRMSACRE